MFCNGACAFCSVPCNKGKQEKIKEISLNSEIEDIGTFEVVKSFFGKEKVRKVKNESRTLGIEYTAK